MSVTTHLNYIRTRPKLCAVLLVIIYSVGIYGFSDPQFREYFISLISFNLLGSFLLLMWFHDKFTLKFVLVSVTLAVIGFGIEVVGVNTGVIFGEYSYGSALGLKLFETPLLIGVNWLMLSYASWDIVGRLRMPVPAQISLAAALMLLYDYIMEPIAIKTGMWQWEAVEIPLQNYLAWYLIAACMFGLLAAFKISLRNPMSLVLFLVQVLFFLGLNFLL